jgi:MFS superfamily sulfate permease-like transporter
MQSGTFKQDLLASIVVFLVALPLCMGIAIASGTPPAAGLVTGIIGGLVVGALSGCPLQVSGPAAGLAVLVYEFIQQHGFQMLSPVIMLAGLIQIAAGVLRWDQLFRSMAPAVIYGMLAGIGILIFGAQFHVMVDDQPRENGIRNLISIPEAVYKASFLLRAVASISPRCWDPPRYPSFCFGTDSPHYVSNGSPARWSLCL